MAEIGRAINKLNIYGSFNELFGGVKELAQNSEYSRLPLDRMINVFSSAWANNPYVQNTRVKSLHSAPMPFSRDNIEEFIKDAQHHELQLRQTSIGLNYSSYPFYKLKTTIASILTYRWYVLPQYVDKEDVKKDEYKRERRLVDKFCKKLDPSKHGRIITQQALDEGKVFRYMRHIVDKAHNKVYAVDLQELPSDYCKIVGRNSDSYYTVAFDFTYFWQPGTSVEQFDPIFKRYLEMLLSVTDVVKSSRNNRIINMARAALISDANVSIEKVGGRYYFWVNLPSDECFTFGADFSSPLQAPMLMGLFLTGADLSQYEYLQKQLLQVPLYAILTGEIPYHDDKNSKKDNDYKLSPTGLTYFQNMFYSILNSNDTSGLDFFAAPVENMKLQTLDSTPNASDIVTKSYQDFNTKAGITGIMSTTDKPMAALVASSQKIESQYAVLIYSEFMNMMNRTFEKLNLTYDWRFVMFGDIFSETERLKMAKEGMTLGILSDTYIYNAILGRTFEDDYSASVDMFESGIIDIRRPLQTSYTASSKVERDGSTPVAGRPSAQIEEVDSEKTEESIDQGTGEGL